MPERNGLLRLTLIFGVFVVVLLPSQALGQPATLQEILDAQPNYFDAHAQGNTIILRTAFSTRYTKNMRRALAGKLLPSVDIDPALVQEVWKALEPPGLLP